MWAGIVVGALVVLLIGVGIGSARESDPASPAPAAAPAPTAIGSGGQPAVRAPARSIADQQFLAALDQVPGLANQPEDSAINTAQIFCGKLREGVPGRQLADIGPNHGFSPADSSSLVLAAAQAYCPEQVASVQASLSAPPPITDGTYVVGSDIQPGTYKTAGPTDSMCYWARLKNTEGGLGSIIANHLSKGPTTVTIKAGDAAFETNGCSAWQKVN